MNEQKKYEVIKSLADNHGNKNRAAAELQLSKRQINRLLAKYKTEGKSAFVHGNHGRQPANTIPNPVRSLVVELYLTKYYESNFTHFTELLEKFENISLSVSAVTSILESAYILSPKVTKKKKKRVKTQLQAQKEAVTSKKELVQIQKNIVAVDDAHTRRPRCAYFGELLQMDASPFPWFGTENTSLHIAVDDATGAILGAYFDKEETLNGYYHVFYQILTTYGIPYKFFTDRRSVFTYKQKKSPSTEEDTHTQFAYACSQLGVTLEYSSIPQAKGRVERMFETLQSRLPVEMRLAGVTNILTANEFLTSYLQKFNEMFSLPIQHSKSVFENQPSIEKINLTLAILTERTVDNGHTIQFQKKHYRMLTAAGEQIHYQKGTKVMVIQSFDQKLLCCVNDKDVYALDEIPTKETKSAEFDFDYQKPKPPKQYIPPMSHPWKRQSFQSFLKKQKHRQKEVVA